jgi:excisionase family DNA binding protein
MSIIPAKYADRVAISPQEAADMLGIDRSTLYRQIMPFVYERTILSFKIGSSRRIVVASLLAFLEKRADKAA